MPLKNVLKGVDWGVLRGEFRGGVRGVRPPLKFAKHMLYNVN
jgi:hypothetical protein